MHIYTVCCWTQEFCSSQTDCKLKVILWKPNAIYFQDLYGNICRAMKIITENPGLQVKKFMIKYPIISRKEQ